eukprot:TRINITY_DN96118_c0_g1_i1.p2 TRINITY_DN96118_c0_g1~~TRINITY_DN96118_c0_g1_i1.p2  ORF type:complete len:135 (-),score=78.01 TRINITY_DN96118_c0_g1_i1:71-475(-)
MDAKIVMLSIESNGNLTVSARAELVEVATFYKGIRVVRVQSQDDDNDDDDCKDGGGKKQKKRQKMKDRAKTRMDIGRFSNVLSCKVLNTIHTIGFIIEGDAFVLHAQLQDNLGSVTYYVPVIADDDETDSDGAE